MNTICPLCGGTLKLAYAGMFDDRYGYPGLFDISRCSSCKSFITLPPFDPAKIGDLYTGFYPRKDIDPVKVAARAAKCKPASSFKQWLSGEHRIHHMMPPASMKGSRILDVGCGDGSSIIELNTMGYDAYGIETDNNTGKVRDALGLRIHIGTIEDAPFEPASFGYILANQVVEHVTDVKSFISNIERFLAPGGTAVLSTPHARSIFRALYGRRWIHWHIPYHQQIMTGQALKGLLEERGLHVIKIRTVSPWSWTVHEINRLRFDAQPDKKNPFWTPGEQPQTPFMAKLARKAALYCLSALGKAADMLGYGNCIIVYATKA